jgi:type I restriction enzyme R subunit
MSLSLHNAKATKEERENWIEEFKEGKIDLLFVYNMLLTGFDAKRLKKLYLGRLIKRHNLLQALTLLIDQFKNQQKIYINAEMSKYINSLIVKEYINEYNRISA